MKIKMVLYSSIVGVAMKTKIKKDKIFILCSIIFLGALFINYVARLIYFYIKMK